jgi:hypothetical protein
MAPISRLAPTPQKGKSSAAPLFANRAREKVPQCRTLLTSAHLLYCCSSRPSSPRLMYRNTQQMDSCVCYSLDEQISEDDTDGSN